MDATNQPPTMTTRQVHERMLHIARFATMGEIAAGIAHEINQPLASITNYARSCEHCM